MELFHKNGTFFPQSIYDVAVVDDFVPDVDGCAVFAQGQFDDLNGAIDAGAEAAGCGEKYG